MKKTLIHDILNFWFADEVAPFWFQSTAEFDAQLKQRYELVWQQAVDGLLDHWQHNPDGALALVIVLDQFPLNMFRGQGKRYSSEAKARTIADFAIDKGFDQQLSAQQQAFLYLPFMHSESITDQQKSIALYDAAGLDVNAKFARHHYDVIKRFGRFPHRNKELNRRSTPEEIAYLKTANW